VSEERKLARVVIVDSLHPIEGADRIELALVGGWQVVAQKGLYVAGSKAIYCEVDSMLPVANPAFSFLASSKNYTVDNVQYARIKTIKLRKQLSQGLLIPLSEVGLHDNSKLAVDIDLTQKLGIIKYESAGEKQLNGNAAGVKSGTSALGFPKFVPKTDQTRVQNIVVQYQQACDKDEKFEKTFKLDGSSLTVFIKDGVLGVASRNVGFRMQTENKGFKLVFKEWLAKVKQTGKLFVSVDTQWKADDNSFTQMAQKAGLLTALVRDVRNLAIQGEMVGPSIQKNFEGVEQNEFYCYDVYLIDERRYMLPQERQDFCKLYNISHVPVAGTDVYLPLTVKEALADADGPSGLNGKMREGFVFKSMTRDFSFKVISNRYLLAED